MRESDKDLPEINAGKAVLFWPPSFICDLRRDIACSTTPMREKLGA